MTPDPTQGANAELPPPPDPAEEIAEAEANGVDFSEFVEGLIAKLEGKAP